MVEFNRLKNRRKKGVDALSNKMSDMKGGFKKDERIWKPDRDSNGNFYGVVRFLDLSPADMEILEKVAEEEGEEKAEEKVTPFVRIYEHAFKGPGGWYIEKSLTSIGEADPVAELNSSEWDDNNEEAKKKVRPRNRRKKYYSNVLIIEDTTKPENNGKVMIFEYGQKIFDKVQQAVNPQFEQDPRFNPFDFYEGADFILKVYTEVKGKNKFPNYDKSEWTHQKPLFDGNDEEIEKVWKQCHSLQDLITTDKFKSYDKLKERLEKVLKIKSTGPSSAADYSDDGEKPSMQSEPEPDNGKAESNSLDDFSGGEEKPQPSVDESGGAEEDDDMDFFNDL